MDFKENNEVECPTCRGLGKVSLNGHIPNKNDGQYIDEIRTFVESRKHGGDQHNINATSDLNNLILLTEMDTIIGRVTELLPEKAPLNNPKELMKSIQIRIKSTNSEDHKKAVLDAVQVARNHHNLLKPHIQLINKKIIHFLNSQRTLYVRLACQSAGELFRTMRCTDQPMFDSIVIGLIYRTADKNQNVRIDANWALNKMVISVPPLFAIKAIVNCHHKNPTVKIAQLRLMYYITVIVGPIKILTEIGLKEVRRLIFKNCVVGVEDANADIRNSRNLRKNKKKLFMSKKILQLLQNSCYESFCSALVHDISRDELKIAEKNLNVEDLSAVLKK